MTILLLASSPLGSVRPSQQRSRLPMPRRAGRCGSSGVARQKRLSSGRSDMVAGDVRLTPGSLRVYGDEVQWEIPISTETDGRHGIVNQLYEAIVNGHRPFADGRWG